MKSLNPSRSFGPLHQANPQNFSHAKAEKNLREQSVSEHVQQYIDTSDVSEHAEHLGERIQNADDVISERIHRKFDHDVGQLEDRPTVQDDEVASVESRQASQLAQDLLRMLSKPDSVRQAILISEILSRQVLKIEGRDLCRNQKFRIGDQVQNSGVVIGPRVGSGRELAQQH